MFKRRTSIKDELEDNTTSTEFFSRYPSTPDLDIYLANDRRNEIPKLTTFGPTKKSTVDLRYKDDPNPYKVSNIDELKIHTQNPFKTKPQLSRVGSLAYFGTGPIVPEPPLPSNSCNNSNYQESVESEYEIPEPDYDGSTASSSEELPLPNSRLSNLSIGSGGGFSPSPPCETEIPLRHTKILESDRERIEKAFSGRSTQVHVCTSSALLYFCDKNNSHTPAVLMRPDSPKRTVGSIDPWELKNQGIPVLLFDEGEAKSRTKRKIQIVLADYTSGLALWCDVVDNLTNYQVSDEGQGTIQSKDGTFRPISTFHTMHLSTDHRQIIGLNFDWPESADAFAVKLADLTSDFANISLSGSKSKKKDSQRKTKSNKPKYVRPKKSDISTPCNFQHISSLNQSQQNMFPIRQFIRQPPASNSSGLSCGSRSLSSNSPTLDISF